MRRPFLAFVVAALSVSYLLPACGGKALVSECQSDADCELGYELCIQGTCHPSRCADCDGGYPPEPPPPPVCESTPKCKEAHPGEEWACLRPGKEDCVKVTSAECPFVSPTWERIVGNVQPLWIGGLFALETKGPNGSLQPSPANQAQLNAMELARREWHATLDGFQVATARDRQPLVAVACDTKNDPARIAAATNHLKKLGVASIIVGSSADAQIALSQPTAGAALYYCADCEPADFPTSGFAGRLVHYRPDLTTSVPPAARAWLEGTEARLRAEGPLANGASLRVAYVTTSAPRRVTAARNIKGALVFNGMSAASQPTDYLEIVTANPIDYATVASNVATFRPDVIFLDNGDTSLTEYVKRIEAGWPAEVRKPQYMLGPEEAGSPELANRVQNDDELRKRITGFRAHAAESTATNHTGFRGRYQAQFASEAMGDAAYEGFYWLAYATAGATSDVFTVLDKLSGDDIARNLPLAIDPTAARVLDVAPTSIFQGYDALYRRPAQPFRLLGTSSEFAYDAKTGAQATDVEVYCPVASNGGKVALKAAVVYRRKLGAFEASFDPSSCGW